MERRLSRTIGHAHSVALRRSALALLAVAAAAGLVGCGSNSADTAQATAVFRGIVEHQYGITAGRCTRIAAARWTCAARINDTAKEIDVGVHGTVWRSDGQWSASGN